MTQKEESRTDLKEVPSENPESHNDVQMGPEQVNEVPAAQNVLVNGSIEENGEAREEPEENVLPNSSSEDSSKIPQSVHFENSCDALNCDEKDVDASCDDSRKCDISENKTLSEETSSVPNECKKEEVSPSEAESVAEEVTVQNDAQEVKEVLKCDLKADAQEFIPKAYRQLENPVPMEHNVQYVNFQPGFVPIPMINPMGDISPLPTYPPPFLPPGIPINFVPPNAKLVPNFVNFIPDANFVPKAVETVGVPPQPEIELAKGVDTLAVETASPKTPTVTPNEVPKVQKVNRTDIDIARIVSKLEQAAKEQRQSESKRQSYNRINKHKTRFQNNYQEKSNEYQCRNKNAGEGRFSSGDEKNYKGRSGFYKKQEQTFPKLDEPRERSKKNFGTPNGVVRNKNVVENGVSVDSKSISRQGSLENSKVEVCTTENIRNPEKEANHEQHSPHIIESQRQNGVNFNKNVNSRVNENCSNKDFTRKKLPYYSDSLKSSQEISSRQRPRLERHLSTDKTPKPTLESTKQTIVETPQKQTRLTNQWISVSSRKKRKNKNANDSEENETILDEDVEESTESKDVFESYDVNQLVDVVPPKQEETLIEEQSKVTTPAVLEVEVLEDKAVVVEALPVEPQPVESAEVQVVLTDVKESEQVLLNSEPQELTPQESHESEANFSEPHVKEELIETTKSVSSKKSKKSQKFVQKRIIIRDSFPTPVDSSDVQKTTESNVVGKNIVEVDVKTSAVAEECKEDSAKSKTEIKETEKVQDEVVDAEVTVVDSKEPTVVETPTSTPDRRSKKKKKKPTRPLLSKSQSVSSSNTTINNLDDSYDFLLENSILDDAEEKTNIEISQELDRMIQKGIYNNLEEKIKSIDIAPVDDSFFSILNGSSSTLNDKNSIFKNADFSSLLKSTAQLFNRPKRNEDFNKINIDFSKIKLPVSEPQPSTSKTGIFVENPEVNEILKNVCDDLPKLEVSELEATTKKSKSNGKLKNKSKKNSSKSEEQKKQMKQTCDKSNTNEIPKTEESKKESKSDLESENNVSKNTATNDESPPKGDESALVEEVQDSPKTLYPITKAVKDWMTKTRENTPEIEILKSPHTIFKELQENEVTQETETEEVCKTNGHDLTDITNGKNSDNEEDITIFSSDNLVQEQDLLECWENDPDLQKTSNGALKVQKDSCVKQNGEVRKLNGKIVPDLEDEDSIEVYESKYGKNEDFLRLQAEIEEKKSTANFPKHGNLPYRAICCSIM